VAITVQCSSYKAKLRVFLSEDTVLGAVALLGKDNDTMVYCKDAGKKDWYGGERWYYPVSKSGPCHENTGPTDSLIIEWTQKGVKLMRDKDVILSREWKSTDGNCLKKTVFWKLQNFGIEPVIGQDVLGTLNVYKHFQHIVFSKFISHSTSSAGPYIA
jgi:hypothetical protein